MSDTAQSSRPVRAPGYPVLPRAHAVGVSVLAFGAAVGAGHLVAGLLSPLSSPYQAVAGAVVRYAPAPLVEFGKTLAYPGLPAGRADKVTLLAGVGVVLVAVAVGAGLASRRSSRPGRRTLLAMGLIGAAAVGFSPMFALVDLVAPAVALGVGLWSFRWLHERAMSVAVESVAVESAASRGFRQGESGFRAGRVGISGGSDRPGGQQGPAAAPEESDELTLSRRGLLVGGVAVGVGALGAGIGGTLLGAGEDVTRSAPDLSTRLRTAAPPPPVPPGADFAAAGTPTFLTPNAAFYRIDTALRLPVRRAADWSLRVHGMVERELTVSYADLLARPLVTRPVTLTCVSNEVGGDLISTADFTGADLRSLLLEAGVRPGAEQLLSTSLDGWTAGTPVDVLLEPDRGALLAVAMNGEPLPLEHGYPVRMVVPGLYGFVSATKWLAELEVTTWDARDAYWFDRGWAREAPIKTQSRIDRPVNGARVPAGPLVVAGIAWAQHVGISGVEVRVDGGPWRPAVLSTEVSRDTWRMWRAEVVATPGYHLLESRAVDAAGVPQTAVPAPPVPDGATGYPRVGFTVS